MITLDKIVEGMAQVQLGQAVLCERLDTAIKKLDCLQGRELLAQFLENAAEIASPIKVAGRHYANKSKRKRG